MHKITFVIAPQGCEFHHMAAIANSIGAEFMTQVAEVVLPRDLPCVIESVEMDHAVFANVRRKDVELFFPGAEIISYYDACRAAGVSPFHTSDGRLNPGLLAALVEAPEESRLCPKRVDGYQCARAAHHEGACAAVLPVGVIDLLPGNHDFGSCHKAPYGWRCTRLGGHDGPCAAVVREGYCEFCGGSITDHRPGCCRVTG